MCSHCQRGFHCFGDSFKGSFRTLAVLPQNHADKAGTGHAILLCDVVQTLHRLRSDIHIQARGLCFLVVFFAVGIVKPSCVNQASNIAYCTHSTPFFTHSQGEFCAVRWRWRRVKGNTPLTPAAPPDAPHGRKKPPAGGKGKPCWGCILSMLNRQCAFSALLTSLLHIFSDGVIIFLVNLVDCRSIVANKGISRFESLCLPTDFFLCVLVGRELERGAFYSL